MGGTLATGITLVSSTQLRATTPAGSAGARDVQVTNPSGQSATRAGGFTYTAPAAADADVGVADVGSDGGRHHHHADRQRTSCRGATVRVGGDGGDRTWRSSSATQLTARTPAGTAGARDVQVTNPNGQSATRAGRLHLHGARRAPTLTSVSPTSGPTAGGTTITLTGTNFVSGATVRVGGTAATT